MKANYTDVYNIKQFSYTKDDKKFLSEASTLELPIGKPWPYMFFIENPETKNRVLFTYSETVNDDEGDMMCAHYKASSRLGSFTAIIFND